MTRFNGSDRVAVCSVAQRSGPHLRTPNANPSDLETSSLFARSESWMNVEMESAGARRGRKGRGSLVNLWHTGTPRAQHGSAAARHHGSCPPYLNAPALRHGDSFSRKTPWRAVVCVLGGRTPRRPSGLIRRFAGPTHLAMYACVCVCVRVCIQMTALRQRLSGSPPVADGTLFFLVICQANPTPTCPTRRSPARDLAGPEAKRVAWRSDVVQIESLGLKRGLAIGVPSLSLSLGLCLPLCFYDVNAVRV